VQNVEKVLNEGFLIVEESSKMFFVFPGIYQLRKSHVECLTEIPAIKLVFSGKTILQAYQEIITERGPAASRCSRKNCELENWEIFPSLNEITLTWFLKRIKKNKEWQLDFHGRAPIFSRGGSSMKKVYRILGLLFFSL